MSDDFDDEELEGLEGLSAQPPKEPTKEEPCVPIRNQATTFAGGCRR